MKPLCLSVLLLLFTMHSFCQNFNAQPKDTFFCSPSVIGLPRAKALVIKYEYVPHYGVQSTAQQAGFNNANNQVRRNGRWDLKLRLPIVYKPSITIAAGFRYFREQFHFQALEGSDNKIYKTLEDRSLQSLGASVYIIKATKGQKYYLLNANFDLNGDFNTGDYPLVEFLKFSITPLIGWKKNDNLSYAFGLSYNYSFGTPMVYPVFSYNRNFNKYWGIETLLPVNVRLRYSPDKSNFFYATAAISGASYRLNNNFDSVFSKYNNLHLHRSEIKLNLSMEKEIYDWLWFSVEGGFRHNLNFNINNSERRRKEVIISNTLKDGFVIGASLFVVPPRSLLKKMKR